MSCLSLVSILNPRYQACKKHPAVTFPANAYPPDYTIKVPCGRCYGCRKRRGNDWRIRALHEFRTSDPRKFKFVTFTFSDESFHSLYNELGYDEKDPRFFPLVIRRFLERYRKRFGKSLRHMFISELGSKKGRFHIHGIISGCRTYKYERGKLVFDVDELSEIWSYGIVDVGSYCNEKSISYIMKYILKVDPNHPDWFSPILVSPGIGKSYVTPSVVRWHNEYDANYYVSPEGYKMALPRYWSLKIFSEEYRYSRFLDYLLNPPPLKFGNFIFDSGNPRLDYLAYEDCILDELNRTIRLGYSDPRKKNMSFSFSEFFESLEFAI